MTAKWCSGQVKINLVSRNNDLVHYIQHGTLWPSKPEFNSRFRQHLFFPGSAVVGRASIFSRRLFFDMWREQIPRIFSSPRALNPLIFR